MWQERFSGYVLTREATGPASAASPGPGKEFHRTCLLLAGWHHRQRLLQTKLKQRLAWHLHLIALGNDLNACTRTTTCGGPDCRTLPASGNSADDCAEHRTAANLLRRVAAATLALNVVVT